MPWSRNTLTFRGKDSSTSLSIQAAPDDAVVLSSLGRQRDRQDHQAKTRLDKLIELRDVCSSYLKDPVATVEKNFAEYARLSCCFTYSGRSSLYLTYKSLGMRKGEVITTPLTCSAALLPMISCGLRPRFVDIDPKTYNIQADKVGEFVSEDTRAVQVIHLAGNPCDMRPIKEICQDHRLILIEDCAQAMGAEHYGEKVGTFGDVSVFSLAKPPICIRGGIVASRDEKLISRMNNYQSKFLPKVSFSIMGRDFPWRIFRLVEMIAPSAYNDYKAFFRSFLYRPNRLQGSMIAHRLKSLQALLDEYKETGLRLTEALKKCDGVKLQATSTHSKRTFAKFMLETDKGCLGVIKSLRRHGIHATHLTGEDGGLYQQRFDKHPLYSTFTVKHCLNYLGIHDKILSLPIETISPNHRDLEVALYAKALNAAVNGQ